MKANLHRISGSLIREIAAKRTASSIDLGLGEPSLKPNPDHLRAGMEYALAHGLRYTVNAGDENLRRRIAAHYAYPHLGSAENVCITTGSQEATFASIAAALDARDDELLVVEPAFPSYAKMAALHGARVRTVAMNEADDFAFDAERILDAAGPHVRMIVICSPCNPTARVLSNEAVRVLSDALLARSGAPVWVLHDEIYREQTFIESAGYFARHYPHTVVTNSVSKSNALTGLRLGWALAPDPLAPAIVKLHAWITSCADTFSQRVAASIFATQAGVAEHAGWYAQRRQTVVAILERSDLRFIAPEGSFYACIRLPEGVDSLRAAHELADGWGVIAIPGVAFGACFAQWLRLTWVGDLERFEEGLRRIRMYCRPASTSST